LRYEARVIKLERELRMLSRCNDDLRALVAGKLNEISAEQDKLSIRVAQLESAANCAEMPIPSQNIVMTEPEESAAIEAVYPVDLQANANITVPNRCDLMFTKGEEDFIIKQLELVLVVPPFFNYDIIHSHSFQVCLNPCAFSELSLLTELTVCNY
jgi:hypothetical protein